MLRIAYVCEFLLALLAISVVWSQVGGQDHLDLMPWYDKFVLIFSLALVTVVGTVAAVSRERAWNGITVACVAMALLLLCAMAAVTYYYHLHEEQDQDTDNTTGVADAGPHFPGEALSVTDAKFGTWVVPESPVDIEYSLVVIEEIRQVVADGFQRLQRGGIEVGGVLYGAREDRIVRILAMREIACEHARGPTFHLSENDRAALTAQLARDKEDMRLEGMLVVGWFLSHTRSDVTLQQSDLDTYSAFFPEPWQVTLVVHPGRAGVMRAGFFVREPDGTVKGERSYQEFNFPDRLAGVLDRAPRERRPLMDPPPADRLPSARYPVLPDVPGLIATGLIATGSIETGSIETRDPRESLDEPRARFDAPLFGQPSRQIPQYSPYPNTGRKIPWAIIGVVVAALLAAVAGMKYFGPQLNAEPLSLGMIEQNGQLQIQWNRASRTILNASGGTLEIVDGQDKRDVPMNRNELAQGSFTYARQSGDVQVRLTVTGSGGRPMVEASRFLGAAPAAPPGDNNETDALKVERDALQDEVTRLRQQTGQQATRIQQLERTLLILQSRLGIAAAPR